MSETNINKQGIVIRQSSQQYTKLKATISTEMWGCFKNGMHPKVVLSSTTCELLWTQCCQLLTKESSYWLS